MENNSNKGVAERVGVSRRVIVKSAAWSVPVFAVVGITPAFAASGDPQNSGMTASRQQTTISFIWTLTIPTNTTISTVTFNSVTGITFSPVTITGAIVRFTGTIPKGNTVPTFQPTVTLSTDASTTFSVAEAHVPTNAIPLAVTTL